MCIIIIISVKSIYRLNSYKQYVKKKFDCIHCLKTFLFIAIKYKYFKFKLNYKEFTIKNDMLTNTNPSRRQVVQNFRDGNIYTIQNILV